jgi:hypothetical protein
MVLPVLVSIERPNTRRAQRAGRSAWLALTAVFCAAFGAIAGLSAPAFASPRAASGARVTFGIQPAGRHHPDARPHFAFGATPGATLTDHVAVLNFSTKPLSLQLYATDAVNTSNGGFGLLPAASMPIGAGAWITLPKRAATVHVPAKTAKAPGQVIVPFVLKVPDKATPGDHVGGIVASLRTVGRNPSGQDVVLEQRVGTRVFIRVSGTLAPKLTLTDLHASYQGTANPFGQGSATVSYQVNNTGNVELALDQGVSVKGLFGSSQQVAVAAVPLLLPGDSIHETAHLPGVWPQFLVRATVTAKPLAATGDADPHLTSVTASTRFWAVPSSLIALLILVIVAVRFGYVLRRRRRAAGSISPRSPERVAA